MAFVSKSALITGASSGIGAAFARALPPTTGMVLAGRDRDRLAAVQIAIAGSARSVEVIPGDLTAPADRIALVAAAEAARIDLLVLNAGFGSFGRVVDNDPVDEVGMVTLNVTAPVELARALLPGMIGRAKAEGGRAGLILVSSVLAWLPMARFATYAATKAFERHWGEALAAEMADEPIDVLVLCPGPTRTGFWTRSGRAGGQPGAMDADAVAMIGLAALGNRTIAVAGLANRVSVALARAMPDGLLRHLLARISARTPTGKEA